MTGADAKFALSDNITAKLLWNPVFITSGILVFAVAYSIIPKTVSFLRNRLLGILFLIFLTEGCYQYNMFTYNKSKVGNPVWVLITSGFKAESASRLYSMKVPGEIKLYMEKYHQQVSRA